MRCERYRRWISDDIDGALAGKKKQKLESHLHVCSACRAYRHDLARIQADSGLIKAKPAGEDYFETFTGAVEARIRRGERLAETAGRPPLGWRWARLVAPLALALILGIVFFRGGGDGVSHEVFSFEGCLDRVFMEIGGDEETAADFNRFLSASLLGEGPSGILDGGLELWSEPFFWTGLSDEDLKSIEAEMRKEFRS